MRVRRKSGAAAVCLFASIVGASSPSVAQYRGTVDEQQACTGDALRICGAFVPDAERITACLRSHYAELSPPCHAVFAPDFETPPPRDVPTPARTDKKPPRPQR